MNTSIRSWLLLLLILSAGNALAEEIAVIVNPAVDISTIDKNVVGQIYMGKSTLLTPYDQPEMSAIRERFYKIVTGRNTVQVKAQWAKLIFSGLARAPEKLINSKAVKRTVASDPKGIGYIEKSAVDKTIKVAMILPSEE